VTRIVWTIQAIEDVEAIRAYIARDSPHYAALTTERIVESAERLVVFPKSGRMVPEVGQESCRELILGTYRVVYRLKGELAEILTVVHSSRLFPDLGMPSEPGDPGT
jgi:addiction module RelE/StbE family toxin